jgi:hypothetical protein
VGALTSLFAVHLQTSSYFRQSKTDRQESRLDRQRDRQHDWLVRLQDSVSAYQSDIALIHQHNLRQSELNPELDFGIVPLSDEAILRQSKLRDSIEVFNSRIDDPNIRMVITNFLVVYDQVVHPADRESAIQAFSDSLDASNIAIRIIGATIRWFDRDSLPKSQFVDVTDATVESTPTVAERSSSE